MPPSVAGPSFDGKGESFSNYAQQVKLRSRVANLGASKQAPALVLRADPITGDVRVAQGSDILMNGYAAEQVSCVLHDDVAPDMIYRYVARFLQESA